MEKEQWEQFQHHAEAKTTVQQIFVEHQVCAMDFVFLNYLFLAALGLFITASGLSLVTTSWGYSPFVEQKL